MDHYVSRVCATMRLLQQHDIIGRTSELARVFGIQFLHVLTRGSQVPPAGGGTSSDWTVAMAVTVT